MKKQTLNITGPWEFREFPETARRMSDLDRGRWLKTDQPQSIHLSLAQAGILTLEDLYAQPESFRWIENQAWVFRTHFLLSREQAEIRHKELIFEGLDTVTQIWLNEKLLGRTDNMFMTHRFDVSSLIRSGENSLVIQFLPARGYANKLMKRYGKTDSSPESASACLRKVQYQFGSRMGPSLVNCGISGRIHLELMQRAELADIHLRTIDCNESHADIRAAITIRPESEIPTENLRCVLHIQGQGSVLSYTMEFGDQQQLSTVLRIERPILWQPKGYGMPFRYRIQAQLYNRDMLLDEKEISFGIRTSRVLRQHEGIIPFALEINQQAIEFKGVYWTPIGLLPDPDEQNKKKYLLNQLAEANINMICIWGDGGYEDDEFYDWCDQMGILVWQELTFPPSYFADLSWIGDKFQHEIERNICRLRNHACLVGWCSGFSDWLQGKSSEKQKNMDSREAFHKKIEELLNEWDPDRDFICADQNSITSKNSSPQIYPGNLPDTHYVFLYPQQDIPCALPCMQTLKITCHNEELYPGSAWIERQIYHPASGFLSGQTEIIFAPPKTVQQQIYQSQIAQARWVKKRIESMRGHFDAEQQIIPLTAGQFWPCAGFSMLDFVQKHNAVYYYVKRGFAPVMVCLTTKNHVRQSTDCLSAAVAIINDRAESLTGRLVLELLDMKGQTLDTAEFTVLISPYSKSTEIILPRAFLNPIFPEKNVLRLAVVEQQLTAENLYLYMPDKYIKFRPMEIDFNLHPISNREILLKLKSRYFVRDLEMVPPQDAYLGDNFINLLPGRDYEIPVCFAEPIIRLDAPWLLRSANQM